MFPEELEEKQKEDREKALSETTLNLKNFLDKNKDRPNMPGWFTL